MKNIIIMLLFTLCCQYLFAQAQPELRIDSVKLNKFSKQEWVIDLLKRHQQSNYQNNDTARYSHTIIQGEVFILSPDHMPCLRPNNNLYLYNQPNSLLPEINRIISIDNMPVIKGKPLIWDKKP